MNKEILKKVGNEKYVAVHKAVCHALFNNDKKLTFDITIGDAKQVTDTIYRDLTKSGRLV